MAANYKAELVGAFGDPIAENPTGVMQEAGFAALGLHWRYLTIEVKAEGLHDAIQGIRAMGFQGINLTIPHKVAVMRLLDSIAPDAAMIGAVNTVRREGDRFIGENTDGKGFLRAVREDAGLDPRGKRVLVLGAGGAARAVCVELALAGVTEIIVVNRDVQRGQSMAHDVHTRTKTPVKFIHWEGTLYAPAEADLLINATSIGLYPAVDAIPDINMDNLRPSTLVCDVIPNPPNTPFLKLAANHGLVTLDGLSMLVYQGTIAFKMWTGHDAPEAAMKAALLKAFSAE
jgi:shikimate dehydrogenase